MFPRMIARSFYVCYLFASGKTISLGDSSFLGFRNKDHIDKWLSKQVVCQPWVSQIWSAACFCTSVALLQQANSKSHGELGAGRNRSSFPIPPPYPGTAFPVIPCHYPESMPVAPVHWGLCCWHQISESQSSVWPCFWAAAQVERAAFNLCVNEANSETEHDNHLPHCPLGPLHFGLVHHHSEKVFFR